MGTPIFGARNGCSTGKIAFNQRKHAAKVSRRIRDGRHMRPYRCDECGLWHLGHLPRVVADGLIGANALYANRTRQTHA